jgi:hypothetical protein
MKYRKLKLAAGDGQLIVVYVSNEGNVEIDVGALASAVAEDAEERLRDGWRLNSVAPAPTDLSGQASFLATATGQHATQFALIAVYSRQVE